MSKLRKKQKVNPRAMLEKSYLDKTTEELESKGVQFFMPDTHLNINAERLTLPKNITEVSSRELGEYMNAFTQQKLYMRTVEGYAELLSEEMRRRYVDVSSKYYKEFLNSRMSETAKEREVNSVPEVRSVYEDWVDCKIKVKMIQSNILSLEEALFMLSREVSRRTGDFENERRADNVYNS